MGTSKSYGGPGGGTPLLPPWACGNDEPDAIPGDAPDTKPDDSAPLNPDDASRPEPDNVLPTQLPPAAVVANPAWSQARFSMRKYATQGGQNNLRNAGKKYSRARGGRRAASRNSTVGRQTTRNLAGFLSDVAKRGVAETLRSRGLTDLLGGPIESVLAGIVNILAPNGATLDDVIARKTVSAAVNALFERYEVSGSIDRLDSIDAAGIEEAIQISVSEFIFQRWMLELGKRIEEFAINAHDAYKMEREVRSYVSEATKLDLKGQDVTNMDWTSRESQRLIDNIFEEAYGFLEDAV
jgi:hypothetical protein